MESLIERLVAEDFTLTSNGSRFARTLEHSSLVIDRKRDRFYWNSKRIFGDAMEYLRRVRGLSKLEAEMCIREHGLPISFLDTAVIEKDEPEKLPHTKVDTSLVEVFFNAGKNHRDYWYNMRGYTDDTINKFKLGYTGEWYTIPIFHKERFVNFQVRKENPKIIKHWYKGVGPHPFNFSVLNFSSWVVVTEGPPDAIMLRQNNIPAISQTGGSGYWHSGWNEFLWDKKRVYIVYDNDDAGRINAKKVGNLLGKKAKIYTFSRFNDKFDITDYFMAGNTADSFMDLLEREAKYDYEI